MFCRLPDVSPQSQLTIFTFDINTVDKWTQSKLIGDIINTSKWVYKCACPQTHAGVYRLTGKMINQFKKNFFFLVLCWPAGHINAI